MKSTIKINTVNFIRTKDVKKYKLRGTTEFVGKQSYSDQLVSDTNQYPIRVTAEIRGKLMATFKKRVVFTAKLRSEVRPINYKTLSAMRFSL